MQAAPGASNSQVSNKQQIKSNSLATIAATGTRPEMKLALDYSCLLLTADSIELHLKDMSRCVALPSQTVN